MGILKSQIAMLQNQINEFELNGAPFKIVACLYPDPQPDSSHSCEKAYDGDLTTEFAVLDSRSMFVYLARRTKVTKITFHPIESLSKKIKKVFVLPLYAFYLKSTVFTFENLEDGTNKEVITLETPVVADAFRIGVIELVDGSRPSNTGWKEISFA